MRVKVRPMRRQGCNLHETEQTALPPFVGELSVAEGRDIELSRPVVRARLLDVIGSAGCDILPELIDVQLLWAADKKLRLSGFERVGKAAYAQTWTVEFLPC